MFTLKVLKHGAFKERKTEAAELDSDSFDLAQEKQPDTALKSNPLKSSDRKRKLSVSG